MLGFEDLAGFIDSPDLLGKAARDSRRADQAALYARSKDRLGYGLVEDARFVAECLVWSGGCGWCEPKVAGTTFVVGASLVLCERKQL
jgi:hypothetical protein